jgi:hypothetical protein
MGDVTVVNVIVRFRDSLTRNLEAANGIEPMNKGFADLRLTTWLRRPRIIFSLLFSRQRSSARASDDRSVHRLRSRSASSSASAATDKLHKQ